MTNAEGETKSPTQMREECIALEAVRLTTGYVGRREHRTTGQIADEAIAKVDAESARPGGLEALWGSWTVDPEDRITGALDG